MDKSDILKGFNNQFEEFLDDVEILFPSNGEIKKTKTALLMLRKANPKMVINTWYRYVCEKYESEINNENIEYFLEKIIVMIYKKTQMHHKFYKELIKLEHHFAI